MRSLHLNRDFFLMSVTPQVLVETVGMHLAMAENRVKNYDRKLMEAGLRTKKGHGRGSAIMSMNDAAMLLIAIASTDEVNDAATTAAYLFDFPHKEMEGADSLRPLMKIVGGKPRDFKKLGPAVCSIMNHFSEKDTGEAFISLEVTLIGSIPVWAVIMIDREGSRHEVEYIKPLPASLSIGGFQVKRRILGAALSNIAKCVAGTASLRDIG
jgi:hypothetical protein